MNHLRRNLHKALTNLPNSHGHSRIQLALRGLEQGSGQEVIRVGLLGQRGTLRKARGLLRLLVADPLKQEEEWERLLLAEADSSKPVLVKIGHDRVVESAFENRLVQEIHVASPMLNGHKLEILVLEKDTPNNAGAEDLLVPTMRIPTSSTGRHIPITTPVHKCLLVSEGILGAVSALAHPADADQALLRTVVDWKAVPEEEKAHLSFPIIDISLGAEALNLFRDNVDNALVYERDWFASGLPDILEWIKSGTAPTEGAMKEPLRKLIESVIAKATAEVEDERARNLGTALSTKVPSTLRDELRGGLSRWADRAHTELRDDLDIAFEGRRWRKLGWWKLFWRVDDVSMIATDILNQRFLTTAEKEIIYVSGCIAQAGITLPQVTDTNWAYKQEEEKNPERRLGAAPEPPTIREILDTPEDTLETKIKPHPWPLEIPVKRAYLSQESVPALQALGQKLVLQAFSTSSLASALAGLMYFSSVSTGLYEAGAVAALGVVWSLRRMQGKWESARKFWEGGVREEGRRAVRSVEVKVGDLLHLPDKPLVVDPEFKKRLVAVREARNAFEKMIDQSRQP